MSDISEIFEVIDILTFGKYLQAKGYADCRRHNVKYIFATNWHRYGEFDKFTGLQGGPFPFPDFPNHPDLTARYAGDTGKGCLILNS